LNTSYAFFVDGTLTIGSTTSPDKVFITSAKDDAVGGDTNGDAGATTPQEGDCTHLRSIPEQ
jgi:hypothetical protein